MQITITEIVLRLVFAMLLGGLIGLERELHGRAAGFRTHILMAVGSALIMELSMYAFPLDPARGLVRDPARLAAQVVSGVGFIGAGTVLREGASIRGLTTAASLWVVSGIGLAVGAGFYIAGLTTAMLVITTLLLLRPLEHRFLTPRSQFVSIVIADHPGQLAAVTRLIAERNINVRTIQMSEGPEADRVTVDMTLQIPPGVDRLQLIADLQALPGVFSASYGQT
ncbi:MAG: MgtC/SapB family protein [Limnochordales bacterium]|nr:MgtC/SapB family protein [Limnochordales bacterium]